MKIRAHGWGWPLVTLVAAVGLLYGLGRLKLLYYFGAFGIDLGQVSPDWLECLFESWFPAQNLLFLVMLAWIALKTRLIWISCVAVAHAMIPLAAHYAFLWTGTPWAEFLIGYRHTLLKLVPFIVLATVWILAPRHRPELRSMTLPLPPAGAIVAGVIAVSWGISTAKHSGSFDAQLALRAPATHLQRVRLEPPVSPDAPRELYLLHAGNETWVLWDADGFTYRAGAEISTVVVPRSALRWVDGTAVFRVQRGDRYF